MKLTDVRKGIAQSLATIPGLRTYAYEAEAINVPCAVVMFPESIDFTGAMQRGRDTFEMVIHVLVSRSDVRAAQDALGEYASGSGEYSIKQAVEQDQSLGGCADTVFMSRIDSLAIVTVGATDYLGFKAYITVTGRNA